MFDLLRKQEFVLLGLGGSHSLPQPADRIRLRIASAIEHPSLHGLGAVLLRPDGYVAWASEQPLTVDAVEPLVRNWLNVPDTNPIFTTMQCQKGKNCQ